MISLDDYFSPDVLMAVKWTTSLEGIERKKMAIVLGYSEVNDERSDHCCDFDPLNLLVQSEMAW